MAEWLIGILAAVAALLAALLKASVGREKELKEGNCFPVINKTCA